MKPKRKRKFWPQPKAVANISTKLIDIAKGTEENSDNPPSNAASKWGLDWERDMDRSLQELCDGLTVSTETFPDNMAGWLVKLDSHITKYHRLLYSFITNYVFSLTDEQFSQFSTNIHRVVEYAIEQDTSENNPDKVLWENRQRILFKFWDHSDLAAKQRLLLSKNDKYFEKIIEEKIQPALSESSKELTSQLVGLVAIFTALSFIVFGGISSLQSLFTSIPNSKDSSILPVLIVALAWTFCMVNLLFGFMHFVLRTIGILKNEDTEKKNIVQKYPLMFLSNFCLCSAFLICIAAWGAERSGFGSGIYNCLHSFGDVVFVFGWIIIGVAIWFIGRCLVKAYRDNPKPQKHTNNNS